MPFVRTHTEPVVEHRPRRACVRVRHPQSIVQNSHLPELELQVAAQYGFPFLVRLPYAAWQSASDEHEALLHRELQLGQAALHVSPASHSVEFVQSDSQFGW